MSITTKERTKEVTDTAGRSAAGSASASPLSHGARSNPVCLEVPVTVRSLPDEAGTPGSAAGEPLREEARTVIVFDGGAVLRVSKTVPVGQSVIVSNAQRRETVCRVVSTRNLHTSQGYIEIEFVESTPDFWNTSQTPAQAASSIPAAPAPEKVPVVAAPVAPPAEAVVNEAPSLDDSDIAELVAMLPAPVARVTPETALSDKAPGASQSSAGRKPEAAVPSAGIAPAPAKSPRPRAGTGSPATPWALPPVPAAVSSAVRTGSLLNGMSGAGTAAEPRAKAPLFAVAAVLLIAGLAAGYFLWERDGAGAGAAQPGAVAAIETPQAETQPSQMDQGPVAETEPPASSAASPSDPSTAAAAVPASQEKSPRVSVVAADLAANSSPEVVESAPVRAKPSGEAAQLTAARRMRSDLRLKIATTAAPRRQALQPVDAAVSAPDMATASTSAPPIINAMLPTVDSRNLTVAPPPSRPQFRDAKLISRVLPAYPVMAKAAHVQGAVFLAVHVDATGRVSRAVATSGPALLHQAAVDSVRQWKYAPAQLDGKPAPADLTVRVDFRLD